MSHINSWLVDVCIPCFKGVKPYSKCVYYFICTGTLLTILLKLVRAAITKVPRKYNSTMLLITWDCVANVFGS